MSRPTIIINELDAERIDRLLEKAEYRFACRWLTP